MLGFDYCIIIGAGALPFNVNDFFVAFCSVFQHVRAYAELLSATTGRHHAYRPAGLIWAVGREMGNFFCLGVPLSRTVLAGWADLGSR